MPDRGETQSLGLPDRYQILSGYRNDETESYFTLYAEYKINNGGSEYDN